MKKPLTVLLLTASSATFGQVLTPTSLQISTSAGWGAGAGQFVRDEASQQRLSLDTTPYSFNYSGGGGGGADGTTASASLNFSMSGFTGPTVHIQGTGSASSASPFGDRNPEDFYGASGGAFAEARLAFVLDQPCYLLVDGFLRY